MVWRCNATAPKLEYTHNSNFYLQTDRRFSYHLDSGLTAEGGRFWTEYRRQYDGRDSHAFRAHARYDSVSIFRDEQRERSTTAAAPSVTGWKAWLTGFLVAVIVAGAVVLRWLLRRK